MPINDTVLSLLMDNCKISKIICPISHDAEEIGKSGVELEFPHDGYHHPLHYYSGAWHSEKYKMI
jgi:hypothetical protein